MKIYILYGENGEYEGRYETTYGAYSTIELALEAVALIPKVSAEGWTKRQAIEARAESMAAERGFPDVVRNIYDKPPWSEAERAQWQAHNEERRKAEAELGGLPEFIVSAEEFWILEFELDASVGTKGIEVWRSSRSDEKAA
jgi:hypothetical protein